MTTQRIPNFGNRTRHGMRTWFDEMARRGLIFHPQDSPRDIIEIATGKALFTVDESDKLESILAFMFQHFDDAVCEAAYPAFMRATGLPVSAR